MLRRANLRPEWASDGWGSGQDVGQTTGKHLAIRGIGEVYQGPPISTNCPIPSPRFRQCSPVTPWRLRTRPAWREQLLRSEFPGRELLTAVQLGAYTPLPPHTVISAAPVRPIFPLPSITSSSPRAFSPVSML